MSHASGIAGVLATLHLVLFSMGYRRVKGTTLTAPVAWAAVSAALFLLASLLSGQRLLEEHPLRWSATWYMVACTTFCPLMAVLGAKRPQHRGWQWVVLTLWVILIWPALQALALPTGRHFELFAAWKLLLIALIALGLLSYLPTKYWVSALLVALGQGLLFGSYLGFAEDVFRSVPYALTCFLVASLLVYLQTGHTQLDEGLTPHTQRWLMFRDAFGTFWALRVLQRVNEAASLRNWPVQLTWSGFESNTQEDAQPLAQSVLDEIQQTLDTLLRRFL